LQARFPLLQIVVAIDRTAVVHGAGKHKGWSALSLAATISAMPPLPAIMTTVGSMALMTAIMPMVATLAPRVVVVRARTRELYCRGSMLVDRGWNQEGSGRRAIGELRFLVNDRRRRGIVIVLPLLVDYGRRRRVIDDFRRRGIDLRRSNGNGPLDAAMRQGRRHTRQYCRGRKKAGVTDKMLPHIVLLPGEPGLVQGRPISRIP
jgi:hypothetical protein